MDLREAQNILLQTRIPIKRNRQDRDIDDDSEEEDIRELQKQHSNKRAHSDQMMDAQELMRERQQYLSI